MKQATLRPEPATASGPEPDPARLVGACDGLTDSAVVVLASWTIVYHVCLVLQLGVAWAVAFELCALIAWCGLHIRASRVDGGGDAQLRAAPDDDLGDHLPFSGTERSLIVAAVLAAGGATLIFAVNGSWAATVTLWLIAAIAGTTWAALRLARSRDAGGHPGSTNLPAPEASADEQTSGPWTALGWAAALAVLSTITLRPNPDDLYYVNLSQWVVDHGQFPLRDTIFSDEIFPMASWPPVASYDALVGTIARLVGVQAASVVYIAVPPVATFLSVLALWRLLRVWQVRLVSLALSISLVFLLFDGASGYASPGNLFLTRLWQGKVILLCLLVPLLLVYALRYVKRPSRSHAAWMFAGGVAAVGLSTSAMFLVPLIAVAGVAPLGFHRTRPLLVGFAAMASYPLAAIVVTLASDGHSADDFDSRNLYRFDPEWFGHQIFLDGALALVAVSSVLLGGFLVPNRAARVTTGLLTLFTGLTFIPGLTRLSYDLVGLGPTLWRVSWGASIAALVGVVGATLAERPTRRSLRLALPLAVVGVLVVFGLPITSERDGVAVAWPPHWQRSSESITAANQALAVLQPGDLILAPQDLAITIDVMTTRVKTVAPRDYFMDYLRSEPGFHFDSRLLVTQFANLDEGESFDRAAVAAALELLGVDEVCLPVEAEQQISFLLGQGYRLGPTTASYSCVTSQQPSGSL